MLEESFLKDTDLIMSLPLNFLRGAHIIQLKLNQEIVLIVVWVFFISGLKTNDYACDGLGIFLGRFTCILFLHLKLKADGNQNHISLKKLLKWKERLSYLQHAIMEAVL